MAVSNKQDGTQWPSHSTQMNGHLHAGHQDNLEDMLGAGRGVPHGHVEGTVNAEGHLSQEALWLLPVAIVGNVDVGEDAMEVEASLLAWRTGDRAAWSGHQVRRGHSPADR